MTQEQETELTDAEKRLVDAIANAVAEKVTQVVSEAMASLAVTQKATTIDELLELQDQARLALERLHKLAGPAGPPTRVACSDASRAADAMLRPSTMMPDTIGELFWNISKAGGK